MQMYSYRILFVLESSDHVWNKRVQSEYEIKSDKHFTLFTSVTCCALRDCKIKVFSLHYNGNILHSFSIYVAYGIIMIIYCIILHYSIILHYYDNILHAIAYYDNILHYIALL